MIVLTDVGSLIDTFTSIYTSHGPHDLILVCRLLVISFVGSFIGARILFLAILTHFRDFSTSAASKQTASSEWALSSNVNL